MHDIAFIKNFVNQIEDKENVLEVFIEVGELSGFDGHHLKHHLEEVVDWKINVVDIPSLIKCSCGFEGEAKIKEKMHDIVLFVCPKCDLIPEVLNGDKIKISKIIYK